MKIIELRASNFARLRAVEIRPAGSLVPVTGRNEQGKTSVLRAIWTALKGRAAAPARPVRDGQEEAVIKLDLGQLIITRRFRTTPDGDVTTDLTVTTDDGMRVRKSPQALIDELLGDLSFDPLAFARMKPAEQYNRLKDLVPGVDFNAIAQKRQTEYERRMMANRCYKKEQTLAQQVKLPEGPEPDAVNIGDIVRELAEATEKNSRRAKDMAEIGRLRNAAREAEEAAERLRGDAVAKIRFAQQCDLDAIEIADNMPAAIDTTTFTEKIASAEMVNTTRRKFEERRSHISRAGQYKQDSDSCTQRISDLDEQVTAAIAGAQLPAGLTLDFANEQVLLNGFRLADSATSVRIAASAEVAMALNPQLRVMLIDEGSELDSEHLFALEKIAADKDYQIWLTRVEEGEGGVGFRIEDGSNAGTWFQQGGPRITAEHVEKAKEKRR